MRLHLRDPVTRQAFRQALRARIPAARPEHIDETIAAATGFGSRFDLEAALRDDEQGYFVQAAEASLKACDFGHTLSAAAVLAAARFAHEVGDRQPTADNDDDAFVPRVLGVAYAGGRAGPHATHGSALIEWTEPGRFRLEVVLTRRGGERRTFVWRGDSPEAVVAELREAVERAAILPPPDVRALLAEALVAARQGLAEAGL